MRRVLLGVALLGLAGACRESTAQREKATTHVTTTNDLDVADMLKRFGVPHEPTSMPEDDAVRVGNEFLKAPPFDAWPQGGEEAWFGKSYNVHADTTSDESWVFFRIKRGRAGDSPALTDYAGYATTLTTQDATEDGDARRLFAALSKGTPLDGPSPAVTYVKTARAQGGPFGIARSDGKSMILQEESPRWFRQSGRRMLLIQKLPIQSPVRKTPFHGAGRYAELWKVP